jgi:hypothetical protein
MVKQECSDSIGDMGKDKHLFMCPKCGLYFKRIERVPKVFNWKVTYDNVVLKRKKSKPWKEIKIVKATNRYEAINKVEALVYGENFRASKTAKAPDR